MIEGQTKQEIDKYAKGKLLNLMSQLKEDQVERMHKIFPDGLPEPDDEFEFRNAIRLCEATIIKNEAKKRD